MLAMRLGLKQYFYQCTTCGVLNYSAVGTGKVDFCMTCLGESLIPRIYNARLDAHARVAYQFSKGSDQDDTEL